ncbi:uncharacterized protein F4812DRAFT_455249 [Daldinia caldariorum]|uniref:uncharacterized protein n=1 Tax=Daldinia caldariorum TaxID=326644 RepID=UPI0020082410|nr:uncharacterized protein F4812DRAFT_455249 [Daldinia caldariorum]KAI1471138.1 hypothetical protein F4812DRAFT_455249 [Daldinia caldariorum]
MSQATSSSNPSPSNLSRRPSSEMMRYYLASRPSTTTDRLVQGNVMSDGDLMDSFKRKEIQMEALVKLAKGQGSSKST